MFTAQEVDNNALQSRGTMTGDLNFGQNANIVFEGATDNADETTLTVINDTAAYDPCLTSLVLLLPLVTQALLPLA